MKQHAGTRRNNPYHGMCKDMNKIVTVKIDGVEIRKWKCIPYTKSKSKYHKTKSALTRVIQ